MEGERGEGDESGREREREEEGGERRGARRISTSSRNSEERREKRSEEGAAKKNSLTISSLLDRSWSLVVVAGASEARCCFRASICFCFSFPSRNAFEALRRPRWLLLPLRSQTLALWALPLDLHPLARERGGEKGGKQGETRIVAASLARWWKDRKKLQRGCINSPTPRRRPSSRSASLTSPLKHAKCTNVRQSVDFGKKRWRLERSTETG